jgi:hypothetical protein
MRQCMMIQQPNPTKALQQGARGVRRQEGVQVLLLTALQVMRST